MRPLCIITVVIFFSGFSLQAQKNQKIIPWPEDTVKTSTRYGTMTVRRQQEESDSYSGDLVGPNKNQKKRKRRFPWIFQKRTVITNEPK
jgi:hypothetical protein